MWEFLVEEFVVDFSYFINLFSVKEINLRKNLFPCLLVSGSVNLWPRNKIFFNVVWDDYVKFSNNCSELFNFF